MTWTVAFSKAADRTLDELSAQTRDRIVRAVFKLAADPLGAANVKRLSGRDELRLRVGDYRVLYTLEHDRLIVQVIQVAHRREAYR